MDISKRLKRRGLIYLPFLLFRDVVLRRIERPRAFMSSSSQSSKSSIASFSVAVMPEGSLSQPLASRREVGDAGIDPSGRPGIERHRGRDVGVP
jgi:hypothetical protein